MFGPEPGGTCYLCGRKTGSACARCGNWICENHRRQKMIRYIIRWLCKANCSK